MLAPKSLEIQLIVIPFILDLNVVTINNLN